MEELETKKYAGIDLGRTSVQFSIYREGQEEMTEESFLLSEEEQKELADKNYSFIEKSVTVSSDEITDLIKQKKYKEALEKIGNESKTVK